MGYWKVILSRIIGRRPTPNQMDEETLVWNVREGKLFGLKVSEDDVKEVVEMAGGSIGSGGGSQTKSEILSGSVDGINRVFATSFPYVSGKIDVYLNGLKEVYFVESSDTAITLDEAPKNDGFPDRIEAYYTLKS